MNILTEWVKKHKELIYFIPPHLGGIVFVKYSMEINSTELTRRLCEEKSTFIVAGDCFGMDGYIRIGIGSEKDYLLAELQLIDTILKEFK